MSFFNSYEGFSDLLTYSAIAVYALALVALAADTAMKSNQRRSERTAVVAKPTSNKTSASVGRSTSPTMPDETWQGRSGIHLFGIAMLLNVGAVAFRGVAAGRAPWGNMYEFVLVMCMVVASAFILMVNHPVVRGGGAWVAALVLLGLGLAVTVLDTPADDLIPVLDSYWLVIHVAAAILSGGVFTLGAIATCSSLWRERREPGSGELHAGLAHSLHVFAFPVWTFAVLAGAVWAENSWGRYWGWDPKETWAFITWVLYAAYLHAESTAGWRGKRASWFALAGFAAFLFNFFGVNLWIPGLHSYAGV